MRKAAAAEKPGRRQFLTGFYFPGSEIMRLTTCVPDGPSNLTAETGIFFTVSLVVEL